MKEYPPFGIEIDGDALSAFARSDYEASVKWHLDLINRSQTGRALLEGIQRTGKDLFISPYLKGGVNSEGGAGPFDYHKGAPAGLTVLQNDGSNNPILHGKWSWSKRVSFKGTGEGSTGVVHYSPSMFGYSGSYIGPPTVVFACWDAAAVLVHELCHAYRAMRGHYHPLATMGGRAGYGHEEDFFAILLTNVFVSDPSTQVRFRFLRKDHNSHDADLVTTTSSFLADPGNKNLMVKLFDQEPGLTKALRAVQADFNPVRQHFGALP